MDGRCVAYLRVSTATRNACFIATLRETEVPFVACDMPNASPFELHTRASMAEEQARPISKRTKDAPAVAEALAPTIRAMRERGCSLWQIAAKLTADGVPAARGGAWTAAAVRNVLMRGG